MEPFQGNMNINVNIPPHPTPWSTWHHQRQRDMNMNVNIPPHPTTPHDQHKIISVTWTLTLTSHPTPPHPIIKQKQKNTQKTQNKLCRANSTGSSLPPFRDTPRFVHNGRNRSGSCHVVCGRHRADAGGGRSVAASVVGPQAPPPAQPELGGQRSTSRAGAASRNGLDVDLVLAGKPRGLPRGSFLTQNLSIFPNQH